MNAYAGRQQAVLAACVVTFAATVATGWITNHRVDANTTRIRTEAFARSSANRALIEQNHRAISLVQTQCETVKATLRSIIVVGARPIAAPPGSPPALIAGFVSRNRDSARTRRMELALLDRSPSCRPGG